MYSIKIFTIFFLLTTTLFSLEVDPNRGFFNLLIDSEFYIDKEDNITLKRIKEKKFLKNTHKSLGFGYSPDFTVWVRFTLENNRSHTIHKVLEYANPLTSEIKLFSPLSHKPLIEGFLHANPKRESIHPSFFIILPPYSSTTFYLKASSRITTLIVKLHLWNPQTFKEQDRQHQQILMLFFGAIGMVIFYNFLILLSTRDKSYLYYVLFFIGMAIHHFFYSGIAPLYLSTQSMAQVVAFSSLIVAFPIIFLGLFIQKILELRQYPKLYKPFMTYLFISPLLTLLLYYFERYHYRNIFSILLLIFIFVIIVYTLYRGNKQAYFVVFGMSLFISSAIFMQLSSLGVYDIFDTYPYYIEMALLIEALIFSLSLAYRIKLLHQEKIRLQENLIDYQKGEKIRLNHLVEVKTKALQESLAEKNLLLKELNHRVKNSIQTIVSFLRLQVSEIEDSQTKKVLKNIENRILAINHLYALLHTKENITVVNSYEYFSLLVEDISTCYDMKYINIKILAEVNIPSEYAIYCGFMLNELVSNALQHAFVDRDGGKITISLKKEQQLYLFSIEDDGIGYRQSKNQESLGLIIVRRLVIMQLDGVLTVTSNQGTKVTIKWRSDE